MCALYCVEVTREIEAKFVGHWERDTKPTEEEVIRWLSDKHYIDDNPEYTKYKIYAVGANL